MGNGFLMISRAEIHSEKERDVFLAQPFPGRNLWRSWNSKSCPGTAGADNLLQAATHHVAVGPQELASFGVVEGPGITRSILLLDAIDVSPQASFVSHGRGAICNQAPRKRILRVE